MDTIKETSECEVSEISVDDRYYSFKYKVWRNGVLIEDGYYENDYDAHSAKEMERILRAGYAVNIAMVRVFEG